MNIQEVTMKLIGNVYPVGETNEDNVRFDNLKELTSLTDALLTIIDEIAMDRDRPEFSISRAGKHCDEFLTRIGIVE